MRAYTQLLFLNPVLIGGREIDRWTNKRGETDDLLGKIVVTDGEPGWIVLTWTGANPPQEVEVSHANISQRMRAPLQVAAEVKRK